MRKAVSSPPQVHEVADGRGAEQYERNAESHGSQQKKILAEACRPPFSRKAHRSRVFHRLRRIDYRVFHVRASLDTTIGRFSHYSSILLDANIWAARSAPSGKVGVGHIWSGRFESSIRNLLRSCFCAGVNETLTVPN